VFLCSTTGCDPNPPADELLVYPPGDPVVTSVTPSSGPPSGGTAVVISGQNLGCAISVSFGSVVAESFANDPALLDCGTTGLVDATSPSGTPATRVPVTVQTAESFFTGDTGSSSALFDYTGAPGSPVITSDSSATAQVGMSFAFTVTTSGNPPIFVSESGPLPNGVRFRSFGHGTAAGTALLEGTPSYGSGGIYYFALTAANRAGSSTQAFTLTVNQTANFSPGRSAYTVQEGEPATIELASTGYPTPAVSITAGTLPAGLNASDGTDGILIISGTAQPGSAGSYPLTVSATNTVGTANEPLTVVVEAGP
jgi:IPT/TIG domain/Putative Ig domain